MLETKRLLVGSAIVTMVILLGSALGSPTLSAYAVTSNHQKNLKDPDNDNDRKACKQDKDISEDQKHISGIQAEIVLDQGHVADIQAKIVSGQGHVAALQAKIVQIQNDLALDQTNPIKNKKDIAEDTKDLKDAQEDLAEEQKDIAGDQAHLAKEQKDGQAHLAKEIVDLNQDIENQKYNHDCDSDKDFE